MCLHVVMMHTVIVKPQSYGYHGTMLQYLQYCGGVLYYPVCMLKVDFVLSIVSTNLEMPDIEI